MLGYVIAGVVVVIAWSLAIGLEIPLVVPALVTVVAALALGAAALVRTLRARRSARALERALAAQADAHARSARPDLAQDVARMKGELEAAVRALKASKGGRGALYALPWYVIVGPPGSGKSTALRASGLDFPHLSETGGGVRGLGGTRNCDFWMTSDAVLLDTAGRWTSEDDDREEWLSFLDLLKTHRARLPLNGVLVAVSVEEIGGANEAAIAALAERIRARIDELQGRLSMRLPVYVLFTKCDLVPGFVETFGELSRTERSEMWGFTAPLARPIGPVRAFFEERFDALLAALERRAAKRMGEARRVADREQVWTFPQQLAALRGPMGELVDGIFRESIYADTPRLRGVYLTSGTQEGRAIDRVMSAMAEAFGQPAVLPTPQTEPKSYFLHDVFARVVFRDAKVALRSAAELRRQRRAIHLAAAALAMLAIGIGALPSIAWAGNRRLIEDTASVVDGARAALLEDAGAPIDPEALAPLRQRALELERHHEDGPPLHLRLGMYPDDVYAPVRATYLAALRNAVMEPLAHGDVRALAAWAENTERLGARPSAREVRDAYGALKAHLLITGPADASQPPIDGERASFVIRRLSERWAAARAVPAHDPRRAQMREHIAYFVGALADDPTLALPRDASTVTRARRVLREVGDRELAVEALVDAVEPFDLHQGLRQLVGPTRSSSAGDPVPGAFTRRGWEQHVRAMLERQAPELASEGWVQGTPDASPEASERRAAAIRDAYYRRYVDEWTRFIESIRVAPPATYAEEVAMVEEWNGGQPRLFTRLIAGIRANVTLEEERADVALRDAEILERARREAEARGDRAGGAHGLDATSAGVVREAATDAVGDALRDAPRPPVAGPADVRPAFEGLLALAPPPGRASAHLGRETPAAVRYEEQLEYLENAHRAAPSSGAPSGQLERARALALAETERIVAETDPRWRERVRSLLMVPISAAPPITP